MGDEFGQKPVLTGPWMVDEWRTGDRIILKRNPNYAWAPASCTRTAGPIIETIVFQSIIEEASRVAAFEAGEIHQIAIPAVDVERLVESGDFWVVDYLRKGVVFIEFNVTKAPFDDVLVRRALNHAINKQDVIDAAIEGLRRGRLRVPARRRSSATGTASRQYAPGYDPEQAKALLAEAGWADTDGDGVLEKDGADVRVHAPQSADRCLEPRRPGGPEPAWPTSGSGWKSSRSSSRRCSMRPRPPSTPPR